MAISLRTTELAQLTERAAQYAQESRAPSTLACYRRGWDEFEEWCARHRLRALPARAETVCAYLADLAERGRKPPTLQQRLSAISVAHQSAGIPNDRLPTRSAAVRATLTGIKRRAADGGLRPRQAAALTTTELRSLLATCGVGLRGTRDRALLLIGFAGGLRRSELVGLDVGDVAFTAEGLRVIVRRSKTDQEGQGQVVGIVPGRRVETCPVVALRAWLDAAGITRGPVFRPVRGEQIATTRLGDRSVTRTVQRLARAAGLDPDVLSAHSLRAGMATQASQGGASERSVMHQGRWTSVSVARSYIRAGDLFADNASAALGL